MLQTILLMVLTHILLQRRSWAPITKHHEDGVRIMFHIFELVTGPFISYIYFQHCDC